MSLTNPLNANIALPAYDIDKIVGIYEGSFNAATQTTQVTYTLSGFANYVWYYEIAHSFGRPVFCELLTSTDNKTWTNNASIAFSDSTKLYIYAGVSAVINTPPAGTIYYRLIASWITGYNNLTPAITPVIQGSSGLYYNSVANQQKIFKTQLFNISQGNTGGVAHNLGYYPNVKLFMECFSGQVWPCHTGLSNDIFKVDDTMNTGYYNVTTSVVNVFLDANINSWGTSRLWCRIYLDQ